MAHDPLESDTGMAQRPRICLLSDLNTAGRRDRAVGAARYATQRGPWLFHFDPGGAEATLQRLEAFACDGVLAEIAHAKMRDRLGALPVPVVAMSTPLGTAGLPLVTVDQQAVGRTAAEHLLQRGLTTFACLGSDGGEVAQQRAAGFAEAVTAYDLATDPGGVSAEEPRMVGLNRVARWLLALPRPTGLFCVDDFQATLALAAAARAPVRVPDELAVVGAGDDPLLRAMSQPALSSVRMPDERVGFEAAALLDRLMAGAAPPEHPLRLQPIGVKGRQSSDLLATADREVAAAVRYIRDHAHEPIQVPQVLEAVAVSRRALERRFRAALGHSPQMEIQAAHVRTARHLLAETDLPIPEVARRSGFTHPARLAAAFRKAVALTPTAYRRQYRD